MGTFISQVNARSTQLEYARVLLKALLVPVLLYYSNRMLGGGEGEVRIKTVQMENLRG